MTLTSRLVASSGHSSKLGQGLHAYGGLCILAIDDAAALLASSLVFVEFRKFLLTSFLQRQQTTSDASLRHLNASVRFVLLLSYINRV